MRKQLRVTSYELLVTKPSILSFVIVFLWLVLLPGLCLGAEYYVDDANGSDSNPGTSELPWQSWSMAQEVVSAGDTVYLTGDFGSIAFNSTSPVGTSDNWITYMGWPGQTAPHFDYIDFTGISNDPDNNKDAYIKFVNIHVDPGYKPSHTGYVVNLRDANYVTFEDSYFEGEKVAGVEGDFAPYVFNAGAIISAGSSPARSSFITIKNSTIKNGFYGLRLVQHANYPERKVENWTVINNDFSNTAEDGIVTSGSGYHYIADNYFHDMQYAKGAWRWLGAAVGDWSDKKWQPITQDTTNASGLFYEITGGWFHLYADDADYVPRRSNAYTWRLDSDPSNTYFVPSGNGDNTHTDIIAVQGASHDIIIEKNQFHSYDEWGGQTIKIEPLAQNITFRNNLVRQDVYMGGKVMLIAGINTQIYNNTIVTVSTSLRLISYFDWEATRTYGATSYVVYDGYIYRSLQSDNLNHIPSEPGSDWWVLIHQDSDVYFYNNIISRASYETGTINSNYNIWGIAPPAEFNEGAQSIIVPNFDGIFVDMANHNFHLTEDSLARDFGDPAYAPLTDIEGNPRNDGAPDAGCYEYVALSFIYGDINGNGEVTSYDAALVARYAVGLEVFTDEQRQKADVSGNGEVSAYDAALIAQRAVGLIDRFPVEE